MLQLRLWTISILVLGVISWEPRMHLGRRKYGMKIQDFETDSSINSNTDSKSGFVSATAFFQQRIDHFSNDTRTFSQKYFYNMQYYNPGGKVVFLMLGGEGPETIGWVSNTNLPYLQWAQQFGAAVFDLEHRFYGDSQPFVNQSVANLKYLSSRQAIEDVAYFITEMNQLNNFDPDTRWITFGGSYSGALSLWARSKHPELVAGAIGSSGPVQATMDFWRYLWVVEASLGTVSGCTDKVKAGFKQMVYLMNTPEGRNTLSTKFVLQPPLANLTLNYNDIQNFYSTIYGNFQGAVQYSGDNAGPYATGYGIPDVCALMNSNDDALDGLVAVNAYMSTMGGQNFTYTYNSYQDMIDYLRIETNQPGMDLGARSWTWQTCNEFGYFQSTDNNNDGIFGATGANNLFINMCLDVFGPLFNADFIANGVISTNKYYGGADNYPGTNVVIPNGSLDPWHALGKYTSSDPSVVWYLINGTAHCADMYPLRQPPDQNILALHNLIVNNIDRWVHSPRSSRTLVNTTVPWTRPPTQYSPSYKMMAASKNSPLFEKVTHQLNLDKPKVPRKFNKFFLGRPPTGLKGAPDSVPANPAFYENGFFRQPVDHFDQQNPATFAQQYWINSQWAKTGGPNFLMIGGEGPESPSWILNGNVTYLTWAKKYGATVYMLEHRYYGDSIVTKTGNDTNGDLTYLSGLQMLYDLANFIRTTNYRTGNTQPWITFGGSYPGALSAWMREVFPDLVLGAVASSAPIFNKYDFYEYMEVVERSVRTYNQTCADNIGVAFTQMHQLALTGPGRKQLSDLFTLDPAWDETTNVTETDTQFFFSNIYGQFQGATQYTGDNRGAYAYGYGIPDMCRIMLNPNKTALLNVVDFNVYMTGYYTNGAPFNNTPNSYAEFITYLKAANNISPDDAATKFWIYQTCNEIGYFQSTDLGYGIFGSPTPVNMFTQMCMDTFGKKFDANFVEAQVKHTDWIYGGRDNYRGTNVVLPNGSLDPWHALGKYVPNDPSVVPILINGTAHCADMYAARPEDLPSLVAARQIIDQNIAQWLGASSNSTGTTMSSNSTATTYSPVTQTMTTQVSSSISILPLVCLLLAKTL